jgi:type II secretory pathway pseudopilin PulG
VSRRPHSRRDARGYALLMVIFLAALMVIGLAVAMPSVLTEGRRQREEEMIWRGQQYDRAIRLYNQKTGRFAPTVEDLIKGEAGIHFLRKAYKDPMNTVDGSWRFIYVTQSGQLVGSIRYTSLAQMAAVVKAATSGAGAGAGPNGVPGVPPGTPGGANPPGQFGSGFGQSPSPNPQNPQNPSSPATPGTPATPGATGDQSNPAASGQLTGFSSSDQPQPLEITEGPVVGGSLIGVASKINQPSIKVFYGGKFYKQWEFIWNPLLDAMQALPGQGGVAPGTPVGQPSPGGSSFGPQPPQSPQSPPPGQPPQLPPQP